MTQLSRFGKIAKVAVKDVRVEQVIRYSMEGSALKGTMAARCLGVATHLEIESDEAPERIEELVRMGEQTCFTLAAVANPTPVQTRVTLNGVALRTAAS